MHFGLLLIITVVRLNYQSLKTFEVVTSRKVDIRQYFVYSGQIVRNFDLEVNL